MQTFIGARTIELNVCFESHPKVLEFYEKFNIYFFFTSRKNLFLKKKMRYPKPPCTAAEVVFTDKVEIKFCYFLCGHLRTNVVAFEWSYVKLTCRSIDPRQKLDCPNPFH